MKYKEIDLAYAAGIIDGEGSIGVYSNKDKRVTLGKKFRLTVQVGMSDPQPIDFLHYVFGGSSTTVNGRQSGYRLRYLWALSTQQAKGFLIAILPYLKGKREQAEVAIQFQKHLRPKGGIIVPLTEGEFQTQKRFSDKLKRLKKFENKETTK